MLDLGAGSGPMNHAFDLKDEWKEEVQLAVFWRKQKSAAKDFL